MAVCVSACMPVSALGAEIAGPAISGTAQENTDNKEETVSEEAIEKKDSGKIEDEDVYKRQDRKQIKRNLPGSSCKSSWLW